MIKKAIVVNRTEGHFHIYQGPDKITANQYLSSINNFLKRNLVKGFSSIPFVAKDDPSDVQPKYIRKGQLIILKKIHFILLLASF